jgi:hypothetical protein
VRKERGTRRSVEGGSVGKRYNGRDEKLGIERADQDEEADIINGERLLFLFLVEAGMWEDTAGCKWKKFRLAWKRNCPDVAVQAHHVARQGQSKVSIGISSLQKYTELPTSTIPVGDYLLRHFHRKIR